MSKKKDLAEEYGHATAFFDSDPGLKKLLAKAIKQNMTPDLFQAELRGTSWFKKHSASWREATAQRLDDPATWKASLAQQIAAVQNQAGKLGAVLTKTQLGKLSEESLAMGWSADQINNSLGSYIKQSNGQYAGEAGTNAASLQQLAWKNGIKVSDTSLQSWVRNIANGNKTIDDFGNFARGQAATLAPGFADQLKSGTDLYDAANPYIQSMATTLEIPSTDVDLFDPTIRGALNAKDPKTGAPTTQTLGDFEQTLRNDPRWMKTQNAQDTYMGALRNTLTNWGVSF